MVEVIGFIGFFVSLIALFVVNETARRANERIVELEMAYYKLTGRIHTLEKHQISIEELTGAKRQHAQRQKETLLALEKKTRAHKDAEAAARQTTADTSESGYIPSSEKAKAG